MSNNVKSVLLATKSIELFKSQHTKLISFQVNEHTNTYMDCMASWMSCIQVLRSSFELARTSIISGFSMPAVMRKRPRSSLATSLTISFWREMTVERWSYRERTKEKKGRD